jgi:hypothetical protein
VLYRLSHPWPQLLFASCVFALNKSFILFRSTLMGDI